MHRQVTERQETPRLPKFTTAMSKSTEMKSLGTKTIRNEQQPWPATIVLCFLASGMIMLVVGTVVYERLDELDIFKLYGSPPIERLGFFEWPNANSGDQSSVAVSGSDFAKWTGAAEENARVEQLARGVIPNYNKIWWARNLLWAHPLMRGQYVNTFGASVLFSAPKETATKKWAIRPWNITCGWDADRDGFTNGEELGDPCCLWQGLQHTEDGVNRAGWTWELSHPGNPDSVPSPTAKRLIESTDCAIVRKVGHYPPFDKVSAICF